MKTISQRQLRNDNAEIVREVEAGETFTVTRRGVPVAWIGPVGSDSAGGVSPRPRPARPAKRRAQFSTMPRVTAATSTGEVLDDLRGDR